MEIYADIILLINFIMNSLILWAVTKLSREKPKYLRIAFGGFVMALMYILIMLVLPFAIWLSLISSVLMLAFGIIIAMRPKNLRSFLIKLFLAYICSFVIGGMGMMLVYRIADVPWTLLLVCIAASYIAIRLGLLIFESVALKKQMLCPVTIHVGQKTGNLQALVDTGHSLQDPINKSPVIIAEFESIKDLLPEGLRLMFYEQQESNLPGLISATAGSKFYERIRMIPFVSLGLSNGMLIGFRPDKVDLSNGSRKDVVIGIYNKKLSGDGRYQGLIAPELYN